MSRLRSTLGYTWTGLAVFIVLVTFIGNDRLSRRLTTASGMTVSPWITGGDVAKTVEHGAYRTIVHRPVFDGLLGERSKGFVQINWETGAELPPVVEERIDLGREKGISFLLHFDTHTGTATVKDFGGSVIGIDHVYRLGKGWAVRIALRRTA
jgi:hypothetical protein